QSRAAANTSTSLWRRASEAIYTRRARGNRAIPVSRFSRDRRVKGQVPMHVKNERGLSMNRTSQIRMTNDEIRRNTEIRMTKPAIALLSVVQHSSFGFLSSFVIRHSRTASWSQCMFEAKGASSNRAKRLECVRFIGAFRPARDGRRFMVCSRIVAADVRRRILARKTLPLRDLSGYGSCDDS